MKIPKAIREQSWLAHCGKVFETKCAVSWCSNTINVFNFHCGHNIPHSAGGALEIENLIPICANCNIGMGDRYTIYQWSAMYKRGNKFRLCLCLRPFSCLSETKDDSVENQPPRKRTRSES